MVLEDYPLLFLRRLLGRLLLLFIHGSKLPECSPVTIIRLSGKTSQEIPSCKVGSYDRYERSLHGGHAIHGQWPIYFRQKTGVKYPNKCEDMDPTSPTALTGCNEKGTHFV